jgi:pimeloyl-ACP methyl ester carboxylesterase
MTDAQFATMPDGRQLCYATLGDPRGRPCFLFHGWPGSRLMGSLLDDLCRERGVCLVAPDRPGFGRSDPQPGRTLLDWPADVAALAEHLAWDRFAAVGISNGGPYALACGAALPARLTGLAVVSGMGPIHRPGARDSLAAQVQLTFSLNALSPLASEAVVWVLAFGARVAPMFMASQMRLAAPPPDQEVFDRPEVFAALQAEYAEAFAQGAAGLNAEIALMRQRWGFALSTIPLPVHLFHGEKDVNVPPELAQQVVAELTDPRARFIPDAAHYWYVDHFAEVLDALAL